MLLSSVKENVFVFDLKLLLYPKEIMGRNIWNVLKGLQNLLDSASRIYTLFYFEDTEQHTRKHFIFLVTGDILLLDRSINLLVSF